MKQERTRKTPNVWQACVILVCVIAAVVAAIKTGVGMVDKILSRSPINFLQAAERCSAACDYPKGLSLRASRRLARQSVFPVPDTQEFSGRTESSAPTAVHRVHPHSYRTPGGSAAGCQTVKKPARLQVSEGRIV